MAAADDYAPFDIYEQIPDVDRYARQVAHVTRAVFSALLDEGFSREEAVMLCAGPCFKIA